MNSKAKVTGIVNLVLRDQFGNIKSEQTVNNLVVNTGLAFIASRMRGTTPAVMNRIAIGTGSNTPTATDTILQTELTRATLTSSNLGATTTFVSTFAAGVGTGSLREAGIFNATTINTGTMLSRVVFDAINKTSTDNLTITWNITIN